MRYVMIEGNRVTNIIEADNQPTDALTAYPWTQLGDILEPDGSLPPKKLPPPPTLEEAKTQARSALREKRKTVEYGGFELNGQHWDSTEKDELRLNSVMRLFEAGVPQYEGWKIADGVYITLTPELVQQAAMSLMLHYGKAFQVEAVKLAEIEAFENAEAVLEWQKVNLNEGW